jgi:8-amino-3,8-dideoxy-alpha-D-manno-octulosonate transaminase
MSTDTAARLAIDGGRPVRDHPYDVTRGLALWGRDEEAAVLDVVRNKAPFRYARADAPGAPHWTADFEQGLAAFLGVSHAIAVSSGTAALTAALIGSGLPEGGEVIVPAVTFIACVNAIVNARGVPIFAEVDDSLTLDPGSVEQRLTERTHAVMPVHLADVAADLDALLRLSRDHGLRLLEDAAQAAGVTYRGHAAGSLGDAGAFSFQADKNITAGEGGALVTDDPEIHDRALRYQDQGGQFVTASGAERTTARDAAFVGTNLRVSELTGAILDVQLRRLPGIVQRLRDLAHGIRSGLADTDLVWRRAPDPTGTAGDLTFFLPDRLTAHRFRTALVAEGIPARTLYGGQPVYANPSVRARRTPWGVGWGPADRCRQSELLIGRSLTIGLGARMTDDDADDVVRAVQKVAGALARPA